MNTSSTSDRRGGAQGHNGARIFLVDIEGSAPSPITGVMTEFGVVDLESRQWFHGRLWDATPDPDIPAKPVPTVENPGFTVGYSAFDLKQGQYRSAKDAKQVFVELDSWMRKLAAGRQMSLTSDNPSYDAMWMTCGFDAHGLKSPFGFSGRRIGDYAAGLFNDFKNTSKWKQLRDVKHSHLAHEDSQGNAGALLALHELERRMNELYPTYREDALRVFKELRSKG